MKATINDQPKPEFKPFDLVITIETKRELEYLWCLLNSAELKLLKLANENSAYKKINQFSSGEDGINTYHIWNVLDNKL